MGLNLKVLKYQIIQEVTTMNDKEELVALTAHIEKMKQESAFEEIVKPMKETISVEEMIKEQNYQGISKEEFEILADDLSIEEPIEDLLSLT